MVSLTKVGHLPGNMYVTSATPSSGNQCHAAQTKRRTLSALSAATRTLRDSVSAVWRILNTRLADPRLAEAVSLTPLGDSPLHLILVRDSPNYLLNRLERATMDSTGTQLA